VQFYLLAQSIKCGDQRELSRVIQTHKLTSRRRDHLVDAYLSAGDKKSQQLLLQAPERN